LESLIPQKLEENGKYQHQSDCINVVILSEARGDVLSLTQACVAANISESDLKLSKLKLEVAKVDQDNVEGSKEEEKIQLDEIQLKTKSFNENLRKNPFDEKLWIQFVDFQEQVILLI